MAVPILRFLSISVFILHCQCQLVSDCSKSVAFGDSVNLTCFTTSATINKPATTQAAICVEGKCVIHRERINITAVDDRLLLTVREVNEGDEGEWTCRSGEMESRCSLNIYKTPTCKISSIGTTSDLSIGQYLPLSISLSDYYCTYSITWNLQIGSKTQNVQDFFETEETVNITSTDVTYSPTVTASLAGRVELTFNCNDETYEISCSGVKELELRDPPNCNITLEDDTKDLTIGTSLTLKAEIDEYPCTTDVEYSLLSGSLVSRSLMVADFVGNGSLFYAAFEVKPEHLNKQLHLKYTCNNVSGTTRTQGVTILLTQGSHDQPQNNLGLVIGLVVGAVFVAVIIGILIFCFIKRRKPSPNKDVLYSDVLETVPRRKNSLQVRSSDTYTEVSDVTGSMKRNHFEANDVIGSPTKGHIKAGDVTDSRKKDHLDTSRPMSECHMVPNVAYVSMDDIRQRKAEQMGM